MRLLPLALYLKRMFYAFRTKAGYAVAHGDESSIFRKFLRANDGAEFAYNDDISGFDQSVLRFHQELAGESYRELMPGSDQLIEIFLAAHLLPVMAPPLSEGNLGFLYEKWGVTTSGIITTSIDGTRINMDRTGAAVAHERGWLPERAVEEFGHSWNAFWLGDDTQLFTKFKMDATKYAEGSALAGFRSGLLPGIAFLSRWYGLGGAAGVQPAMPFITRLVQQTVFNEHGGRSEDIEVMGFHARVFLARRHPKGDDVARHLASRHPALQHIAGEPAFWTLLYELAEKAALRVQATQSSGRLSPLLLAIMRQQDRELPSYFGALLGSYRDTAEGGLDELEIEGFDPENVNPTDRAVAADAALKLGRILATPVADRTTEVVEWPFRRAA